MKVSKFNHYYNCDGEIFIYNARTTALANIEKEKFEALSKFTSDNSTKLDNDFIKDLEFGGFILPKDVDELYNNCTGTNSVASPTSFNF